VSTSLWNDLFRRGLEAFAPTSPGFQGGTFGFYYAEDTEKLYFWDGDEWVEVPLTAGGGGPETNYPEVSTWADLPDATTHSGDIYIVQTTTGIIGFRKLAGLWRSDGASWIYLGLYGRNASEIVNVPAGTIAATDVQAALNELDGDIQPLTGWGAYVHTGSTQALAANTKVTLTNNAGTILHVQKPSDIAAFYSSGLITGREGDGIAFAAEMTFMPDDGTASNLSLAIDIGGSVGEVYPAEYPIIHGALVAHKISYNISAYTLDTWEANGGVVKVEVDGPGVVSGVRYVIHRIHKAR
jgi:hypothetical protein